MTESGTRLERAGELLAKKQYQQAMQEYRAALDSGEDAAWAWLGIARCNAYEIIERGEQMDRLVQQGGFQMTHADVQKMFEKIDQAVAGYDRALSFNPSLADAHAEIAGLVIGSDRDKGFLHLKMALDLDPDNPQALWMYGKHHLAEKRVSESLDCFSRAVSRDSGRWKYWISYAQALTSAGERAQAIDCYKKVLALNPLYTDALDAIGSLYLADNNRAEARRYLEAFARAEPVRAEHKGVFQIFPELKTGAGSVWESSSLTPPVSRPATPRQPQPSSNTLTQDILKGRELVLAGKKKEAVAWFDDLIAKNPASDQLWVEKGIALGVSVRIGNMTSHNPDDVYEALRCFERAVALNPRCINAFIQQGVLMNKMLDFTKAHAALDKALAIDPSSIGALMGKAMTCGEAARFAEAVEYCDRCLRLNASLIGVRTLRDRFAAELKKPKKPEPLPGINFRKQFPESGKPHPPSPLPPPVHSATPATNAGDFSAELAAFHNRFARCCGRTNDGHLRVEPDCLRELVAENPDRAHQYIVWCCSDPAIPLRSLELVSSIGMVIKVVYSDSGPLDRIMQRLKELRGKTP